MIPGKGGVIQKPESHEENISGLHGFLLKTMFLIRAAPLQISDLRNP